VRAGQEAWPERAAKADGALPSFHSFAWLNISANRRIGSLLTRDFALL